MSIPISIYIYISPVLVVPELSKVVSLGGMRAGSDWKGTGREPLEKQSCSIFWYSFRVHGCSCFGKILQVVRLWSVHFSIWILCFWILCWNLSDMPSSMYGLFCATLYFWHSSMLWHVTRFLLFPCHVAFYYPNRPQCVHPFCCWWKVGCLWSRSYYKLVLLWPFFAPEFWWTNVHISPGGIPRGGMASS